LIIYYIKKERERERERERGRERERERERNVKKIYSSKIYQEKYYCNFKYI